MFSPLSEVFENFEVGPILRERSLADSRMGAEEGTRREPCCWSGIAYGCLPCPASGLRTAAGRWAGGGIAAMAALCSQLLMNPVCTGGTVRGESCRGRKAQWEQVVGALPAGLPAPQLTSRWHREGRASKVWLYLNIHCQGDVQKALQN